MTETEKQLKRRVKEFTALHEVGKAVASSLEFKDAAAQVLRTLAELLDMRRGTLTLLDPASGHLAIAAAHGLTAEEIERGKYKIGEGITGKVVDKGQPMVVPDIGREPLFLNRTRSRGDIQRQNIAFICVPIQAKGETLGVLSVDRLFKEDVSLEEDVRLLTVVASLVGQNVLLHRLVDAEREKLIEEKRELETELKGKYRLDNVVGESGAMKDVYRMVRKVAPARSTVMIRGESGTGKELIARALHVLSPRSERPFLQVSCAALPETLLESELFGHEKGSFTGAVETVKGRFELAEGGTLFLDEIGDISLATQVKLLRVLQERKFERVGGTKTLTADVRILAATNRNLEAAIAQGRFREDLYYRLNVVPIFLPPLRERSGDIPLLVDHFLFKYNRENGKDFRMTHEAMELLVRHDWPGNVRELENTVERMCVMARDSSLGAEDVPKSLGLVGLRVPSGAAREGVEVPGGAGTAALGGTLHDLEKRRVVEAMENNGWVQARACKALGITPRQLGYKLKKYKIEYKPTIM
jgi:Nif-specific regulatory protein